MIFLNLFDNDGSPVGNTKNSRSHPENANIFFSDLALGFRFLGRIYDHFVVKCLFLAHSSPVSDIASGFHN